MLDPDWNAEFFPLKLSLCSEASSTDSYEDKKPHPLKNNEDQKLSLIWEGENVRRKSGVDRY